MELQKRIKSIVQQENASEGKGEGVQDGDKTSDNVRGLAVAVKIKREEDGGSGYEDGARDVTLEECQQRKDQRNSEGGGRWWRFESRHKRQDLDATDTSWGATEKVTRGENWIWKYEEEGKKDPSQNGRTA